MRTSAFVFANPYFKSVHASQRLQPYDDALVFASVTVCVLDSFLDRNQCHGLRPLTITLIIVCRSLASLTSARRYCGLPVRRVRKSFSRRILERERTHALHDCHICNNLSNATDVNKKNFLWGVTMSFLTQIKIGQRAGAAFAIVLLLLGAVCGIGLIEASRIYDGTKEIGSNWLPSIETLGNIRSEAEDVLRVSLRMLLATDASERLSLHQQHEQSIGEFSRLLDDYSKLVSSVEERRLFEAIKTAWAQYLDEEKK